MIEATEDTVIGGLQALACYGSIATQETWKALATPENAPIFLSSLIQRSLGPTLAFLLSFWTFSHQENVRREKEAEKEAKESEAVRLMMELEIKQNLATLEGIGERLQHNLLCFNCGEGKMELIREGVLDTRFVIQETPYPLPVVSPSFERTVYDTQIGKLSTAYRNQPHKLSQVIRHYHYLSTFSRLFERYHNIIPQWDGDKMVLLSIQQYLKNDAHFFRNLN